MFESPRGDQYGVLTGKDAGPVLKTVRACKGMGINTSALRQIWKAKRSGIAAAWKANGTRERMGIVFSAFRQNGKSTRQAPGTRSKRDGRSNALGIKTSAFRQLRDGAVAARQPHKLEVVGAIPAPASNMGRANKDGWCRRCAVNAVPLWQEVQFHP